MGGGVGGGGIGGMNYNYRGALDTSVGISEGKPRDTMDFFNKINKVGHAGGDETGRTGGEIAANERNLATKLEIDNFPSLPDYEGIQPRWQITEGETGGGVPLHQGAAVPLNRGPVNETMRSGQTMHTLNSVNVERINQRNEDRLREFEARGSGTLGGSGGYRFSDPKDELAKLDTMLMDMI